MGAGHPSPVPALPGIEDGLEGVRFIAAALASHQVGNWIARPDWPDRG
ncbi:hypothetical protein [Sphingobium sp. AP50]|nr:hypothetical protein [Sphingobium sp. AP50]